MKPIIDVTLEKGSNKRFTKWFKYENTLPDNDTRDHPQVETASGDAGLAW